MIEILIVITSIALISVVVWMFKRLGVMVFTMMMIYRSKRNPELRNERHGIVFNKKLQRLEADQSLITPF